MRDEKRRGRRGAARLLALLLAGLRLRPGARGYTLAQDPFVGRVKWQITGGGAGT